MKDLRFKKTLVSGFFRLLSTFPKADRYIAHPEKYSDEECFALAKKIMNYLRKYSKTTTDVYGAENLPSDGGYVMYANHQGRYDGVGILLSQEKPCSALWRRDKTRQLGVRQVSGLIRAKAVDTDKILETARTIKEIAMEAGEGKRFLIFPEGYYDENHNELQEFHDGCFRCSLLSHTPIVPVTVYDSYKAMNTNNLKKVNTQVHYLEPIYYDEYGQLTPTQLAALVKQRIQSRLDEISGGLFKKEKSFSLT